MEIQEIMKYELMFVVYLLISFLSFLSVFIIYHDILFLYYSAFTTISGTLFCIKLFVFIKTEIE